MIDGKPSLLQLPFDQYQRYRLAADIVEVLEGEGPKFSILEVGGFPPKLHEFLPDREIMVVDKEKAEIACYQTADGAALPFTGGSYDLTLSLDALEHVEPKDRHIFIGEMLRTARSFVIIAAPFKSPAVAAADRAVFEFIKSHSGYEHKFLKEHLEIEPPELEQTRALLVESGLDVMVLPCQRIDRWLTAMTIYYTFDGDPELQKSLPSFMEVYNSAFYQLDNAEPAYRHFIIAARGGLGPKKDTLTALVSPHETAPVDHGPMNLIIENARALALRAKDREREALLAELQARDEEIKGLKEENEALRDFMKKVKSLPLYAVYEKLFKPFTKK